jgi:hypothetical protein
MKRKRLADWFEKMSAAFMVGAFLTDKSFILAVGLALVCLGVSLYHTNGEKSHDK